MSWKNKALLHAIESKPCEACGLIVNDQIYIPCQNIANDKLESFIVDPNGWIIADNLGEVTGIFHSHPDCAPQPSEADIESCNSIGITFFIVNPDTSQWHTLHPE